MFAAVTRSLAAKKARIEKDEKGFTLIELLVVVIIIGILAAIAIPIFLGQQEAAKNSAVESDLNNAKTAVIAEKVSTPTFTLATGALPTLANFTPTSGVTINVDTATASGFCLEGTRTGSTDVYSVTDKRGVKKEACTP